ncbi:uncharacterized protein LOC128953301 [Oppia nitens]|uniref:uncharacterized protein LOC128953301 n=1 Tax=Oppia nitens TaxID=1686743 RepID=UPI0023DA3443|nr:uncharacterized protein LOC128953301 [Oppia nitens]
MNFILAITTIVCLLLSSVISIPHCPVNNLWEAPPDYAGLATKFQSKSNDQLIHLINQDIDSRCQLTDRLGRQFKRQSVEILAQRYATNCVTNRLFNDLLVAGIVTMVTDDQVKHQLLLTLAQWNYYWTIYFTRTLERHKQCTMKQLGYGGDVLELQKQFDDKRNQTAVTLEKLLKSISNDLPLLKPIIDKVLDLYNGYYAFIDKMLANLTPEATKVKTLQYLLYETDLFSRGFDNLKF